MIFLHSAQCALHPLHTLASGRVVLSACRCTVGCMSSLSKGKISLGSNHSPQIEQSNSAGRVPRASLRHIPSQSSGLSLHIFPDGTGKGSTFPSVSRGIGIGARRLGPGSVRLMFTVCVSGVCDRRIGQPLCCLSL
jgi:hypothetical protein